MYATCHTTGCGNAGIPIPIPDRDAKVVCGVCSSEIVDITDTPPEPPKEMPTWLD